MMKQLGNNTFVRGSPNGNPAASSSSSEGDGHVDSILKTQLSNRIQCLLNHGAKHEEVYLKQQMSNRIRNIFTQGEQPDNTRKMAVTDIGSKPVESGSHMFSTSHGSPSVEVLKQQMSVRMKNIFRQDQKLEDSNLEHGLNESFTEVHLLLPDDKRGLPKSAKIWSNQIQDKLLKSNESVLRGLLLAGPTLGSVQENVITEGNTQPRLSKKAFTLKTTPEVSSGFPKDFVKVEPTFEFVDCYEESGTYVKGQLIKGDKMSDPLSGK